MVGDVMADVASGEARPRAESEVTESVMIDLEEEEAPGQGATISTVSERTTEFTRGALDRVLDAEADDADTQLIAPGNKRPTPRPR